MLVARAERSRPITRGRPTWEIVQFFPKQGEWTEDDFFALEDNRRLELSDGCLEILPMPTEPHQAIMLFLYSALQAFVSARKLGKVMIAGLPLRLWVGKLREPDILFLKAERFSLRSEQCWNGADLVMEIVSKHNRPHDIRTKRLEYAKAGIPEYWIIDPQKSHIVILKLNGRRRYTEQGVFGRGEQASSVLLRGFSVEVSEVLDAE